MNIHEIESVCAVDTYKNYSEAAFRIASSPAVISKHVARVEEELGIQLFERATKTKAVALTPEGEKIIGFLRAMLNLYHRAVDTARELTTGSDETLTVGYAPFIGGFREEEILTRFSMENPHVTLIRRVAGSQELINMLVSGTIDAAMLPLMEGSDTWDSAYANLASGDILIDQILAHNTLSLGLPADHPLAGHREITKEDFPLLAGETFLFSCAQMGAQGEKERRNLSRLLGIDGVMHVRFVDYTEPTLALKLVEKGAGILPQACIVPRQVGNVVFVPLEGGNTATFMYFVHRRSTAGKALRALRACALQFAGENRPEPDPIP